MNRSQMAPDFPGPPAVTRKKRSVFLFAGIEVAAICAAVFLAYGYFPQKTFWVAILGAGAIGWLLAEGIQILLGIRRAKAYSNRFDLRDEISQRSVAVDDVDKSLQKEEIIEEFLDLGRRSMKEEKYEDAVEHFHSALELAPHQSRLYNFLGIALGRMDRHEEAVEAYTNAISIDYDYSKAHFNLALAYEEMSRLGDALEEWTRYVDVGEVVGERADMLERARQRVQDLKEKLGS